MKARRSDDVLRFEQLQWCLRSASPATGFGAIGELIYEGGIIHPGYGPAADSKVVVDMRRRPAIANTRQPHT
jgi:hypothetical protein